MPVAVPRSGFTILDERSASTHGPLRLSLPDFFKGEDALRDRIASKLVPPSSAPRMRETARQWMALSKRLRHDLKAFDPTLVKALERSVQKMRYQLKQDRGQGRPRGLRRDERAARDAASLYGLIYPERHLQERLYSILPLLAKHGFDLVDHVYDAIELDCADHRLMVV